MEDVLLSQKNPFPHVEISEGILSHIHLCHSFGAWGNAGLLLCSLIAYFPPQVVSGVTDIFYVLQRKRWTIIRAFYPIVYLSRPQMQMGSVTNCTHKTFSRCVPTISISDLQFLDFLNF